MNIRDYPAPRIIYEEITIPVDVGVKEEKKVEPQEKPSNQEINIPFGWTE